MSGDISKFLEILFPCFGKPQNDWPKRAGASSQVEQWEQ